jgi:hypothetical protein
MDRRRAADGETVPFEDSAVGVCATSMHTTALAWFMAVGSLPSDNGLIDAMTDVDG